MEIRIQQKATIWYETTIEAESPEKAVLAIINGTAKDLDWWQALDSTDFPEQDFWYGLPDGTDGEISADDYLPGGIYSDLE